jgi:DNA-binding MarR family transcriptional regulator
MKDDRSDIEYKITTALEKITQVEGTVLRDIAKRENLSPIQIQFLIHLSKYPLHPHTVSSLAREFDLTKATVSEAIQALENKNLITKSREEGDRRSYDIALTTEGKNTTSRIQSWENTLIKHLHRFPPKDKRRVFLFLAELIKSLYDDGVITIPRMCIACKNLEIRSGRKKYYCTLTERTLPVGGMVGCEHYTSERAG